MNNTELEQKLFEIIGQDNFFDMVLAAKAFEPEYKKSDFYKETKMPLSDVIKQSKLFYALQLKDLGRSIQNIINSLSLDNLNALFEQISETFGSENAEILKDLELLKSFKD